MKRWHEEEHLMQRRWRREIENHRDPGSGLVEEGCHCLLGKGFMRKRRPGDKCKCRMCALMRNEKRRERRQKRYAQRAEIQEQLQ